MGPKKQCVSAEDAIENILRFINYEEDIVDDENDHLETGDLRDLNSECSKYINNLRSFKLIDNYLLDSNVIKVSYSSKIIIDIYFR